jgi:flagellar motor switch protein FliM
MAGNNDQMDQDAIAAQWEASLDSEDPAEAETAAAANEISGTMALQWAAMVEDGSRDLGNSKNSGERVLSQEEIDNLLGFTVGDVNLDDNSGIRAIIDSAMVSYERLPMLEIVFDRLVRLMTTSLRNFTSDNVEVSLDRITSVRFGDYMNSIPLPAVLSVFKAEEWENFGLATVDSSLIYSMVDVLLGGRRGQTSLRIEGRPYTSIETNLVKRLVEVVLADGEQAFRPLSPVTFTIDRLEDQSALRRDLEAGQRCDPGALAHRHGGPRRQRRAAAALRDHRAHPRRAVADVHGREVRPRPDLGRASRDRDRSGRDCGRGRALCS